MEGAVDLFYELSELAGVSVPPAPEIYGAGGADDDVDNQLHGEVGSNLSPSDQDTLLRRPKRRRNEDRQDEEYLRRVGAVAAALFYVHMRRADRLVPHSIQRDVKFDLSAIPERECKEQFRFEKAHIPDLARLLGLPPALTTRNGLVYSGVTGLCILLWRLRYPSRLGDGLSMFGRSVDQLSRIHNDVASYILRRFQPGMSGLDRGRLQPELLRQFANAVSAQGAPLPNCVGFIDGTLRAICRPTRHQRIVYNGHKRFHGLKFQSVVTPDGIVAHLFGPVVGRVHDARLFNESGLLPILEEHFNVPAPLGPFYLYGDPAYGLNRWVVCPYKGAHLTAAQEEFNRRMSSVREAVEWAFGKVVNLFAFVDYKKNLKLGLQQVGSFYIVAVLLTNCHTCLYGGQISDKFGVAPPTLQDYLQSLRAASR